MPRTEYSAQSYRWPPISAVTGRRVDANSPAPERGRASLAFRQGWNYDSCWSTMIDASYLGEYATYMRHAACAGDGSDRRDAGSLAATHPTRR